MPGTTLHPTLRYKEASAPAERIPTSQHGQMCCNSMLFSQGFGKQLIETISSIASQCDGVRCDMAMLLLNAIFERTWGQRAGQQADNGVLG